MQTLSVRLTLTAFVLFAGVVNGQNPVRRRDSILRADVNLVLVPVTVTDRNGQILDGLDRSRFRIFEEGVPQPIVSFSTEELPASVGLILDISGSMKPHVESARAFAQKLLDGMEPEDETLFLTCADRPDFRLDFSTNTDRMAGLLRSVHAGGWTALNDSIYLGINRMKPARNSRKVLVIVSDGQDNQSRYSNSELLSRAIESEAQIYSVAIHSLDPNFKAGERAEEMKAMELLHDLARATGGQYFQIDSDASVARAAEKIILALHHQYLIGYYSPEPLRKGPRRIQVKLDVPDAHLYNRSRYYPAAE